MRIQLSRMNKIEKAVHKATMPEPRAITVFRYSDGTFREYGSLRPISQEELDGYDDNDDNFILILEVENQPPVQFIEGHGAVHPSPPLSTDEWAERSKIVHGNNMGNSENPIPCIE